MVSVATAFRMQQLPKPGLRPLTRTYAIDIPHCSSTHAENTAQKLTLVMAVQVRSLTLPVTIPAAPAILSSAEQTAHESDCDIERDIGDEPKWKSDLDAGDVAISSGRREAEIAAERVAGDKAVANDTVVRLQSNPSASRS